MGSVPVVIASSLDGLYAEPLGLGLIRNARRAHRACLQQLAAAFAWTLPTSHAVEMKLGGDSSAGYILLGGQT